MDIHALRAFQVVAEELNFRRSAEILSMSQPPLTRLIAKLEDELRVQLFVRTTRKVELTAAGFALLTEAREILDKVQAAVRTVREVGALKRGELRIDFTSLAFYSALPKLLANYREHFPHVSLVMNEKATAKIFKGLDRGETDLIFREGSFDDKGYESINISQHDLGVLFPANHVLAKRKRIKLNELNGETFILHPRREAPGFYDAITAFMNQHQMSYHIRSRRSGEGCPVLVATDQGLLLSVQSVTGYHVPNTRFVPLESPAPKLGMFAVWKKREKNGEEASTELQSMISFLKGQSSLQDLCSGCLMGSLTGPAQGQEPLQR